MTRVIVAKQKIKEWKVLSTWGRGVTWRGERTYSRNNQQAEPSLTYYL